MDTKKWLTWTLVGAGAIVLAAVALVLLASSGAIAAQASPAARIASTGPEAALGPGHPGRHGWGPVDWQELLAEELGISVEELEAAIRAANQAAIEQLVEEGYLTEEQADQLGDAPFGRFGPGGRGCDGRGGPRGGERFFGPGPRPGASDFESQDA